MSGQSEKGFEFDFDEWAELYRRSPEAFEARRQTVLALEIARAGPVAEPAKHALRRLDHYLEGKTDTERMRQSMVWMVASMRQLSEKMHTLGEAVGNLQAHTHELANAQTLAAAPAPTRRQA